MRFNGLYKRFSSLKTSIPFLGLLSLIYLVGTIFPQGGRLEDYIREGGRFVFLVRSFNLLNIFTTPVFLTLALLLFINLTICGYERLLLLLAHQEIPEAPHLTTLEGPAIHGKVKAPSSLMWFTHTIPLPVDIDKAGGLVEGAFIRLGFKKVSSYPNERWGVMEKGLPYRWLTWLYHLGIFLCFIGLFLTYLFAFEDEITLYPGETKVVSPKAMSRWQRLTGASPKGTGFQLGLEEFITEYNQVPTLEYPKDKLSRLAMALGWWDRSFRYRIEADSLFPKDWKSRLKVIEGGKTTLTKTIEVNDPLHYRGFTFYQMAFKQDLWIQVDDGRLVLEVEAERELIVPGVEGALRFGALRVGTLFKMDGGTERIRPSVEVFNITSDGGRKRLGRLEEGGRLFIGERAIGLKEFKEASVISYRYDPGVPILWWAGILVLIAMALRVFGLWYRVIYRIEEGSLLDLAIKARGLLADEERVIRHLRRDLRMKGLKTTERG